MRSISSYVGFEAASVNQKFTYRRDIDGLRAIAIIPVLVFHAFPSLLPGGFLGVDVFFAISGFLIASLIFDEVARGTFSIAGFYRRRIRRIFPALAVVLATCIVVGWRGLFDAEYLQLARHALFGAFGLANLSLYTDTGYFSLPAETNPMLHLWSLGVEEQFYLLLPATLLLVRRRLVWLLLAAFAVSLALCAVPAFSLNARFYLPQFRVWELLAGVLLAYAMRQGRRPKPAVREILSCVGLACLGAAFLVFDSKTPPALSEGAAVAGALALIAAGPRGLANRWVLSNPWMVGIGLVSYSLYLWHWPLIAFSNIVRPGHDAAFRVGALAIAFVLSVVTYLLVERPARRRVPVISSPPVLAGTMAVVALAAGLVVFMNGRIGWAREMQQMNAGGENDPKCLARFWPGRIGREIVNCSDPKAQPTVALIGDSHAHHLYPGIRDYYAARGQHVVVFSMTGCPPFPERPIGPDCVNVYRRFLDKIDEIGTIKTVIVGEYVPFMEPTTRPHWLEEARTMFWRIASRKQKIVLMLDIPPLAVDPRVACQVRPLPFALTEQEVLRRCSMPRAQYDKRVPAYRGLAAQAIHEIPNARVFDLAEKLCNKTICPAIIDGHLIYRDDNHLNIWGSRYMARFYDWEGPPVHQP